MFFLNPSGTVNANSNLVCEVVFYPSFYAPLIGSFSLNVDNGNSMDLHAEAMVKFLCKIPLEITFTSTLLLNLDQLHRIQQLSTFIVF